MNSKVRLISRAGILVALLIVCALTPPAWGGSKYRILHSFDYYGKDGIPSGPPLPDGNGNLYGNTYSVVFELTPEANGEWREVILHAFKGGADGSGAYGPLIWGSRGKLYGTVVGDVPIDAPGVFELARGPKGWRNALLYTKFAGPGVLMDKLGNIYGEMGPGQHKYGAIAELSPGSHGWTYKALYSFCVFNCGYDLPAPPIWDGKGNLWGTTTDGGISQPACWTGDGCGVIFELTPNQDGTWSYHIRHRFASYPDDGQTPYGGLVMDNSGNFYGTTEYGGAKRNGTVYKFSLTNGHWEKTVVYDFPDWHDGALPNSTLVLDKAGNLYGVGGGGNQGCGPYTCGVVFKLTPQKDGTWSYSVIHKFSASDGNFPIGVIVDDKGNVFGTTSNGGKYNSGVAFEITP